MLISILFIIISLFLEGILSLYSPFITIFTASALILSYKYFNDKKIFYWILVIIVTIAYDLLYTNIIFLNTYLYIFILTKLLKNEKEVGLNKIIKFYILYNFLLFSILYILKVSGNIFYFVQSILTSIPINIVYFYIMRLLLKERRRKSINY